MNKNILFIALIFILIAGILLGLSQYYVKVEREKNQLMLENVRKQLMATFDIAEDFAKIMAVKVANKENTIKNIGEYFDKNNNIANITKDSELEKKIGFLRKSQTTIKKSLDYNNRDIIKMVSNNKIEHAKIKQAHFHIVNFSDDKKPESVLRLHDKNADRFIYIEKRDRLIFRKSIFKLYNPDKTKEKNYSSVCGAETGVAGLGLRCVVPIVREEALVGSFEIGLDPQPFIDTTAQTTNTSILILIDYAVFKSIGVVDIDPIYRTNRGDDKTGYVNSDRKVQVSHLACPNNCNNVFTAAEPYLKVFKQERQAKFFLVDDRAFYIYPFKDVNKDIIGLVLIAENK